jgi:fructose-1-phosphate kinase PfkB-like protein
MRSLDFGFESVSTGANAMTAPHIFTLTGNLLAERTFEFGTWSIGGTYRANRESFQVGGKGINVSKMLNRLGLANTALCFVGGAAGHEAEAWLTDRGFSTRAFRTSRGTRVGLVVRSRGMAETTFLGPDVPPDAEAISECADFLDRQAAGGVLALCGSFPGWSENRFDPLRDALARWLSRGCLVADTYGPPLAWLAPQPIELLKINSAELRSIETTPNEKRELAALRLVITDGANPIRLREGAGSELAVSPPPIREVSPTGSGDVMLACLIDALFRQRKSLREAVNFALPYAAANAAHSGVAEFPNPA